MEGNGSQKGGKMEARAPQKAHIFRKRPTLSSPNYLQYILHISPSTNDTFSYPGPPKIGEPCGSPFQTHSNPSKMPPAIPKGLRRRRPGIPREANAVQSASPTPPKFIQEWAHAPRLLPQTSQTATLLQNGSQIQGKLFSRGLRPTMKNSR